MECKPYEPDYLQLTLNGHTYYLNVFRINGKLYSENIRYIFPVGEDSIICRLDDFLLWDAGELMEEQLPGVDDTIVMGTPDQYSYYMDFVSHFVPYKFTIPLVDRFTIPMDVLCTESDKQ